jgi:hypothetical protein
MPYASVISSEFTIYNNEYKSYLSSALPIALQNHQVYLMWSTAVDANNKAATTSHKSLTTFASSERIA